MIIYGIVTAVIGVFGFILGYGYRAAQCGPCSKAEIEPELDELDQAWRETW